eukprot:scaffold1559_cov193-Alexandrium_tamarense.AAC.12
MHHHLLFPSVPALVFFAGAFLLRVIKINHQTATNPRQLLSKLTIYHFKDPKSVSLRASDAVFSSESEPIAVDDDNTVSSVYPSEEQRNNCQIIYVLGVEGATHHGFLPILVSLARNQMNTDGIQYDVQYDSHSLRYGLFGWYDNQGDILREFGNPEEKPRVDDPTLVRNVISQICPNDGQKHVIIEDNSFPCGQSDDPRSYRIHRQQDWLDMSPEELANSWSANNQPTNLYQFYDAYRPYADVKFVVLHRPFLETIASHAKWDTGPAVHSNIIRGFMLILRRFLDAHQFDMATGERLWTLVCVEKHFAKFYDYNDVQVTEARNAMLYNLASFMMWPTKVCHHCFDSWHESEKDYSNVLGNQNMQVLDVHMQWLEGVWPPISSGASAENQCRI